MNRALRRLLERPVSTRRERAPRPPRRSGLRIEVRLRHQTSEQVAVAQLAAYRPPPRLSGSAWADAERRLSPESSASPGRWRTARAEYQRGFMDAATDPEIPEVLGVFASQTGKTDCVLNLIGFHIHHDPAPMLIVQPTLEMAEAWSKDRLSPMLRDTPALRGRVQDAKTRDSGNTIRHKVFPGGHLTASGANSPVSLASRPIRVLAADEIDGWPMSAGVEGNPLKLAETRTAAFWNAKKVYITSPRNKGSSISWEIWERSDQRRFFVPCHACGEEQFFKWKQVKWDDDDRGQGIPSTARYECEHCGVEWNDAQRWAAVRKGRWIATAPYKGCAGFHVSALAAPWESRRLEALVKQFLEAQGKPDLLKVFINTVLAEWWEEKYHGLQGDKLEQRRELYPMRDGQTLVPKGVAIITAGVDVQDDRIEVQLQGYGRSFEQWKLEYHVLQGDPSGPHIWTDLWNLLKRPMPLERGGLDYVRATAVDTGAHALRAYDYCRPRFRVPLGGRFSYTFAIKGRGGSTGEFWPRAPSRTNKGKVPLYTVRVDAGKELLYAQLHRITEPGPGFIHFPLPESTSRGQHFDARYFEQLTAEHVRDKTAPNGVVERVWELRSPNARNEALDTSNYGEAALRGLIAMGFDLDQEAARIAKLTGGGGDPTEPPPTPAPGGSDPRPARRRPARRVSRSSYLRRDGQ